MWEIEVPVVLLEHARLLVPWDSHLLGHQRPLRGLLGLEIGLRDRLPVQLGGRDPHLLQDPERELERLLAHDVRVAVVVHHHVELVRSHHAVEPEVALQRAPSARARQVAAHLQQHLDAFAIEELLVAKNHVVVPDGVGHRHVGVDLDVDVLPRTRVLRPGDRGEREARALAVELLCPHLGLLEAVVSVQQQIPGGFRIDEHHHPVAVDLAVPEDPAEVDLAGHALAQGVQVGVLAVVRLIRLEAGEAQALQNARVAVDFDVHARSRPGPRRRCARPSGRRTSHRRGAASTRRPGPTGDPRRPSWPSR